MPETTPQLRRRIKLRYRRCPIDCPIYLDNEIATLSDFFGVFHALLEPKKIFWFRGHTKQPTARLALPSLRRRVVAGPQLKAWLDKAISTLASSHPAHAEFSEIRRTFTILSGQDRAREQVAAFYKQWFDLIAAVPKAGRSMALFQDLSTAYALGKSLPDLVDEGTARRPESVVEPLMLSCL